VFLSLSQCQIHLLQTTFMADVPTVAATLDAAAAPIAPINFAARDSVAADVLADVLSSTSLKATNNTDPAPPAKEVKVVELTETATWEELGVASVETRTGDKFSDVFNKLNPPWVKPTSVQASTIPKLLQGQDYIVQAPAGQGKTGAFLITALALLAGNRGPGPHIVIVTPSMELVDQLKRDVERLTPGSLPGTAVRLCRVRPEPNDMDEAKSSPHGYAGYDIVAASIGKLATLIGVERTLFMNVKLFVADEADKLLHIHSTEFKKIVGKLPTRCQRTFWSATIDDDTENALREMTRIPRSTNSERLDPSKLLTENCANYVVSVPSDDAEAKYAVMELIERFATFQQMLVFATNPSDADFIAGKLRAKKWSVDSMHGKNTSAERTETIDRFRKKEVSVLISTDILSRGLDCANLNCVVNWGMPRLSLPHLLPFRLACA
jgi:ATP-dependent RNA helicase RhlE